MKTFLSVLVTAIMFNVLGIIALDAWDKECENAWTQDKWLQHINK